MTHALAWTVLALSLAFAAAPLVTSPFTGFTADQLPIPQIDPPVQPAGWAFSIWGLIYLWLIASSFFGLWRRAGAADWRRARGWLALSLVAGVPWLWIAQNSALWALAGIAVMAAGAIGAFLAAPKRDVWLARVPFAILAGWLSAAAFVALGTTAAGYGVLAEGRGWALICIAAAAVLALTVQARRPEGSAYGLTVSWALLGIAAANGADAVGLSAALALTMVLGGTLALNLRARRR